MFRTAFITRFESVFENDVEELANWLSQFANSKKINQIYVICNEIKDKKKLNEKFKKIKIDHKIKFVNNKRPISSISMNSAIKKLPTDTDFFIIASKEVTLSEKNIETLIKTIKKYLNMKQKILVVGYKFRTEIKGNKKLDEELQEKYNDNDLIAFKVPWNTCAIWNYDLFTRYVIKFDNITDPKEPRKIELLIDKVSCKTDKKGMEDGLAIAKAVLIEPKIKYHLIDINKNSPLWKVNPDKIPVHRKKLARKDIVLRNFMVIRGYSEKILKDSRI